MRKRKVYKSNFNISLEITKNNIELMSLTEKYVKDFNLFVKDDEKN